MKTWTTSILYNVDQWDWEKIISKEERTMETLINTVRSIYSVLRKTEKYMAVQYDYIEEILPKKLPSFPPRNW